MQILEVVKNSWWLSAGSKQSWHVFGSVSGDLWWLSTGAFPVNQVL